MPFPTSPEAGSRSLEGIRVLDLTNLLAGPMCTMHLADHGADVIKVEHPTKPDELRGWGYSKNGVGLYFKVVNRNKRLITLNLSKPEGQAIARELAKEVDVVISAFRPGTVERWGLDYETLSAENPRLIQAQISGYGRGGPQSSRPGFGTIAEAYSGFAAVNGFPDGPPTLPSFGLADATTAIFMSFAIMVALRERDQSGKGQEIDAALYESLFTLIGPHVVDYDQLGIVQQRTGNRLPFVSPRTTFPTADGGWVAIAGSTQATFERTVTGLGIPHVIEDPRFADNRMRLANAAELEAELAPKIAELNTDEVVKILDEAGAPGGPVMTVDKIFEEEQYVARKNLETIEDADLGPMRMQTVTPRLSRTPGQIRHSGLSHGEHTDEIYRDLLGKTTEELDHLKAEGII